MKKNLLYLVALMLCMMSIQKSIQAQCYSSEGTIMVNSLYICEGDAAIVDADDFLLIPGQSVYYVYHTNSSASATNPPTANQIITLGSFLQNGSSVGGTVYVTAFGATSDGSGGPDYSDPCLTVSNTIALNFLNPIAITVEEDCDTGNGEFNYTFTVTGGLPGAVIGSEYTVTGDYFNGPAGLSGSITIGPITDGSAYGITVIDDNGCEASYSGTIACDKLPVELISFDVYKQENAALIQWQTATETENSHFTLYKSKDGIDFSMLKTIEGAGSSIESTDYSHVDIAPYTGITYYRLTQTDYDGTVSDLGIRSVRSDAYTLEEINIYAMPVNENLAFSFYANEARDIEVKVLDIKGSILREIKSNSTHGLNNYNIDITDLHSGAYVLQVLSENTSKIHKFVKN